MKKIYLAILMLSIVIGNAQVTNEGKPTSWKLTNKIEQQAVVMEKFDLKKLQAEDIIQDKKGDAPWRFGFDFVVNLGLENAGIWTVLPNGDRIWTLRIQSKGAKTLNFLLDSFLMPKGGHLYLYNNDRTDVLGAYNEEQNNENQVLGTWLVSGEDVWLEYYEPKKAIGKGKINISKVIHGYRTTSEYDKTADLNTSGDCNHDVNCPIGSLNDKKDINKKAVAMMITGGSGFCTGSLVNNTANDGKKYFLTANHCYSNPANWAFRFNWISTNNVCATTQNSTSNSNYYQTVSGATLRARRTNSDFCLVEINSSFPSNWDIIWAGWDRTATPATTTFGIHHPNGDIMKVCRDDQAPTLTNYTSSNQQVWRIEDWNLGVTEGGSSGSPLYNQDGRLVGQLWRGAASCVGTNDNNAYDEYGRFNVSWDAGGTAATQLKNWLDPSNTGAMTTDVYPTQQVFQYNASIEVTNINSQLACGVSSVSPILKIYNYGSVNLTSASISYSLNGGTATNINWSGNLATNAFTTINLPTINAISGANTFNATINNPNGQTDQAPNNNNATFTFSTIVNHTINQVTLTLQLDNYGSETTWNFKNSANVIIAQGGPYTNSQATLINQNINLPSQDCYTFTIDDTEDDGICCGFGAGYYQIKKPDNTIIFNGGDFGTTESKTFSNQTLSINEISLESVIIAPNPSNGIFNLQKNEGNLNYKIFNLIGQELKTGSFKNITETIDISNFSDAIYILKLESIETNAVKTFKLIKRN